MTGNRETQQDAHVRFVSFLLGLARTENRGALAALRRGLGRERTPPAEMLRLVVPYLPQNRPWEHRWYFLVASLFGLHPETGGKGDLGDTFRSLGAHESAQKRFVALLDAHPDDLPYRLRQAVALAKSKEAPVNWFQLLEDLFRWQTESRYVQQRWARSYWARRNQEESNANQVGQEAPTGESQKGA